MSRSFSVHVTNEFGPVIGLKLKVSEFRSDEFNKLPHEEQRTTEPDKFEQVLAESVTDAYGTARFRLHRTGVFTLSPVSPASQFDWVELDVADQRSSSIVKLRWPSYGILGTTRLRGKLMKGLYWSRSSPLDNTQLKLHTLTDYREVAGTITGHDGEFDFGTVAPGLYLLELVGTNKGSGHSYESEGNIAVSVSLDAHRNFLQINTAITSCGLSYDLEQNKARYKSEACFQAGKPVPCDN